MSDDLDSINDLIRKLVNELQVSCEGCNPLKRNRLKTTWYNKNCAEHGEIISGSAWAAQEMLEEKEATLTETFTRNVATAALNNRKHVVISLHGIQTRGDWQKRLSADLSSSELVTESLDYGTFWFFQMLIPSIRRKKIDWFLQQYTTITERYPNAITSIVAHSFGTYMVANAMRIYPQVKFFRVVLCGAIVEPNYPWDQIIANGQATNVLNEYGGQDFWAGIVANTVEDSGPSGRTGFTIQHPNLLQHKYPGFRHSDYFNPLHYREYWIPFITGKPLGLAAITASPSPNLRYRRNKMIALVLLALALIFTTVFFMFYEKKEKHHKESERSPIEAFNSKIEKSLSPPSNISHEKAIVFANSLATDLDKFSAIIANLSRSDFSKYSSIFDEYKAIKMKWKGSQSVNELEISRLFGEQLRQEFLIDIVGELELIDSMLPDQKPPIHPDLADQIAHFDFKRHRFFVGIQTYLQPQNGISKASLRHSASGSNELTLVSAAGDPVIDRLKSLHGKIVLVDFFATWCGPCIIAFPKINRKRSELKDLDFEVLSVCASSNGSSFDDFVSHHSLVWPTMDISGDNISSMKLWAVDSFPTYWLIGRDGKPVRKFINLDELHNDPILQPGRKDTSKGSSKGIVPTNKH